MAEVGEASLLPVAAAPAQRGLGIGVLLERPPLLALLVAFVGSKDTGALGTATRTFSLFYRIVLALAAMLKHGERRIGMG